MTANLACIAAEPRTPERLDRGEFSRGVGDSVKREFCARVREVSDHALQTAPSSKANRSLATASQLWQWSRPPWMRINGGAASCPNRHNAAAGLAIRRNGPLVRPMTPARVRQLKENYSSRRRTLPVARDSSHGPVAISSIVRGDVIEGVGGDLALSGARMAHGSFARFFNSANARPARRPSLVAVESSSLAWSARPATNAVNQRRKRAS